MHRLVWEWVYRPVTRTRHPNSFIVKTCRRGCLVRVKSQIDVHWVAVGNFVRHQGVKVSYGGTPLASGVLYYYFGRIPRVGNFYM